MLGWANLKACIWAWVVTELVVCLPALMHSHCNSQLFYFVRARGAFSSNATTSQGWGQLRDTTTKASSTVLPRRGVGCSGSLKWNDRASSLSLGSSSSILPRWGVEPTAQPLVLTKATGHQHSRPWTQTWPWAAILAGSSPWDQVVVQVTHIRLFFTTLVSPAVPLHSTQTVLFHFLIHLSITYSIIVVVPTCTVSATASSSENQGG